MIVALAALALLQQDAAEHFYKFKVGTTWTYKLTEGPFEGKSVVTVTKHDGDKVHVESKDILNAQERRTERLIWHAENGLLTWSKEVEEGKFEPMFHLYKAGTKKGDTWRGAPESAAPLTLTATHQGAQDVKVPAGTFKDVVVVALTGKSDDPRQRTDITVTYWLAPKVGVVKMVVDFGDDRNSLELLEFADGK